MDLTYGTPQHKTSRAKKMMLWFGIISMAMMFAGLTSAYVVSKSRPDWLTQFELPVAFYWSTLVILLSSVTYWLAKKNISAENHKNGSIFLVSTLALSAVFIYLQFEAFGDIISSGYYVTGSESTVTTSMIYLLVFTHLLHLAAGIVVLLVVIYNHFKQRYHSGQTLGLELGGIYWHFVDALWVYLFFFLYFFR